MAVAAAPALKHTPLHKLHLDAGARFTAFAGYDMPVQYADGILREHLHTRAHAGLFDISHMGQIAIRGNARAAALEALTPADVIGLPPGRQRYALLTNNCGGIIDDIMIANLGDELILVVNAASMATVFKHLTTALAGRCTVTALTHLALLALQGPKAAAVLARLAPALAAMPFQSVVHEYIDGIPCRASRSGYTGEDGYEIMPPAAQAEKLARHLLAEPEVKLIGLGARDSLRLEAGLCLYGHDIGEQTPVLAAGLGWTIAAARRTGGTRAGGFPGAAALEHERAAGPAELRVGLLPAGRAPLRAGTELMDDTGATVGRITSGGFSPTLNRPLAMGYLRTDIARQRTPVFALLRSQRVTAAQTSLPFVPHRYYRN
jgi:aminomethyltransferase